MLVGLLAVAAAQVASPRMELYDALLDQAAHGDDARAAATYTRLTHDLSIDDPLRGEALYWLGHAHHLRGDQPRAREALIEGIRTDVCPTRCRDLLEKLELEEARVASLPVRWTFDDAQHGLFHPWRFGDRGPMQIDQGLLRWTTLPDPQQFNRLVMGFSDVGTVHRVALDLEPLERDMRLQVVVTDRHGRQFGLPDALRLRVGQRARAVLEPRDFVPVEDAGGVLDPRGFAELWLVDITPQGAQAVLAVHELLVE